MGYWNETCFLSNLPIKANDDIYLLVIATREPAFIDEQYEIDALGNLFLFPIEGKYDEVGGIYNIKVKNILYDFISKFEYIDSNEKPYIPSSIEDFLENLDNIILINKDNKIYFSKLWVHKTLYDDVISAMLRRKKGTEELSTILDKYIIEKINFIKEKEKDIMNLSRVVPEAKDTFSVLYSLDKQLNYRSNYYTTPSLIDYIGAQADEYIDDIKNVIALHYALNRLRKGFFCNIGLGNTCEETHLHRIIAKWILDNTEDIEERIY